MYIIANTKKIQVENFKKIKNLPLPTKENFTHADMIPYLPYISGGLIFVGLCIIGYINFFQKNQDQTFTTKSNAPVLDITVPPVVPPVGKTPLLNKKTGLKRK